jgi:TatD DNase family protein
VIDIGANLTNHAFSADLDAVLARAEAAGVDAIIVTGTSIAESRAAVVLCERFPDRLWCTVGVHPHDAATVDTDWLGQLALLARAPRVCAIGETGLDFNRNYSPPAQQHAVFQAQLELAGRVGLPVFVHERDSGGAVAQHLHAHRPALRDVIVHCFTGSAAELDRYLGLDCHIGITGWICDERRGTELASIVARIPDDRLLIETDAPFLLPRTMTPRPRSRRNEPANLPWIVRALALARGQSDAQVSELTAANARRVFRLDGASAVTTPVR